MFWLAFFFFLYFILGFCSFVFVFATDFLCAEFFSLVLKFAEEIVSLSSLLFCTDSLLALKQQQKIFLVVARTRMAQEEEEEEEEEKRERTRGDKRQEKREREKEREKRERNTRENRNKTIKIHVTEKIKNKNKNTNLK